MPKISTSLSKDSLLTNYTVFGDSSHLSLSLTSYRGKVLKYEIDANDSHDIYNTANAKYFNKILWLEYCHKVLKNLPDSLKLTNKEKPSVLKAYYNLLGVDVTNEYGWICEYGTVGAAPSQRQATIILMNNHRNDLLKKLLYAPNLITRIYASESLLYLAPQALDLLEDVTKSCEEELKKHYLSNPSTIATKNFLSFLETQENIARNYLTTKSDSLRIKEIFTSDGYITTCGNCGSFKLYKKSVKELMTEENISKIKDNYEKLRKLGYFNSY